MRSALPFVLLIACGGAPERPNQPPAARPTSALAEAIEAATSGRVPAGTAVVTFAAFLPGAAPDDPVAAAGADERTLTVVAAPVDAKLPLDLVALSASVSNHGERVGGAHSVVFVRYAGPRKDGLAHVRAAAEAALALAADGVVVDLGTRRAYTQAELRTFLQSEGWGAEQIVVEAQQDPQGQVMFVTYGMARLGLPDLELSGVEPAQARLGFGAFQVVLHALQARTKAAPGDTVGDVVLRACTRPPEAYEQACVRM